MNISFVDKLQHNAAQFEQHAGKLKRKYWWKNMKVNAQIFFLFLFVSSKKPSLSLSRELLDDDYYGNSGRYFCYSGDR